MDDLFVAQIQDLYDAEQRLTKALPKMADAASSKPLKSAFQDHLRETQQHVVRLEKIFEAMGLDPQRETCEAMKGLIAEGEEVLDASGDSAVKDAALIAAASVSSTTRSRVTGPFVLSHSTSAGRKLPGSFSKPWMRRTPVTRN